MRRVMTASLFAILLALAVPAMGQNAMFTLCTAFPGPTGSRWTSPWMATAWSPDSPSAQSAAR